jgi:hypothetical protein
MGKRTISGRSLKTCDHTGIPLPPGPACYLPLISKESKLQKKGHYCNWESVMAAVAQLPDESDKPLAIEHIRKTLGGVLPAADLADPGKLIHFGGSLSAVDWQEQCLNSHTSVSAVIIRSGKDGKIEPVEVPLDAKGRMDTKGLLAEDATRVDIKRASFRPKDRQITAHFSPHGQVENRVASKMFRMDIKGDVVVGVLTRELCFLPRERYVPFTVEDFEGALGPRKPKAAVESAEDGPDDETTPQEQ